MCTGKSIVVHVKRWLAQGEDSIIPELAGGAENITAKHISEAYDLGDKLIGRMIREFETYHTNGFPVEFHTTQLGSDSGLIGAMELLF